MSILTGYEKIKSIALTALFSDDDLMEMLVFKGGNALNLIYKIAARASVDLDFSIQGKIESSDFPLMEAKIKKTLNDNFKEAGYSVIDFKFYERPKTPNESNPEFWGGYRIEFKVINKTLYAQYKDKPDYLRQQAETIGENQTRTFFIDISKYEYCKPKIPKKYENYNIYVYSPQMIAIEKLRAICQQMPEYMISIKGKDTGISERARDFYDIYIIIEILKINLLTDENQELLENIFSVKKVPIQLLSKINMYREFHSRGYDSLRNTVPDTEEIKPFDFYFDYVVELAKKIITRVDNRFST